MAKAVSPAEGLKNEIAQHCVAVERLTKRWQIPMCRVTIIARDPEEKDLFVVVTNEDPAGLKKALELAGKGRPMI
jgi:hypothetical protein